jgi:hypothetical protein
VGDAASYARDHQGARALLAELPAVRAAALDA